MASTSTETTQEQRYVKFADPSWDPNTKKGGEVSVKLRLLDFPGVGVFRHWIGEGKVKRPYTCPGKLGGCPACKERAIAKLRDTDNKGTWRSIHRMDHRDIVNVLELTGDEPKLRIYQINNSVMKRLDATIARGEKYSDPTTYDITVMKRRTGGEVFDIEYDVFYDGHRDLTATEKALASKKNDLKPETVPASPDEIGAAMAGTKSGPVAATPEQKEQVLKVLDNQGLKPLDVEITDIDNLTAEKAAQVIKELG